MRFAVHCGLMVVLLATMWFQVGEGTSRCLFICGRKRDNIAPAVSCPFTCGTHCGQTPCSVVCANACHLEKDAKKNKDLKPFPREFETFDQDHDGYITLKEFAKTVNADENSSAAALKLTDTNGDGRLDEEEFNATPYHKIKGEEQNQD